MDYFFGRIQVKRNGRIVYFFEMENGNGRRGDKGGERRRDDRKGEKEKKGVARQQKEKK